MNYDEDISEESKDNALLFRTIDAKVDPFSIPIEKEIEKLPEALQFVKEYLYFHFLPALDMKIEELEKIKETPNYDENLIKLRPNK